MGKVILKIYALALLERVCNFFVISAFTTSVLVVIICGTVCNSAYMLTCNLAESLVKNLTRIQLP